MQPILALNWYDLITEWEGYEKLREEGHCVYPFTCYIQFLFQGPFTFTFQKVSEVNPLSRPSNSILYLSILLYQYIIYVIYIRH
jgi:hypothetical protein